jgi:hypothetical protein
VENSYAIDAAGILKILLYVFMGIYSLCHILILPMELVAIGFADDPNLIVYLIFMIIYLLSKYVDLVLIIVTVRQANKITRFYRIFVIVFTSVTLALITAGLIWGVIGLANFGFPVAAFFAEPLFFDYILMLIVGGLGIAYAALLEPSARTYIPVSQNEEMKTYDDTKVELLQNVYRQQIVPQQQASYPALYVLKN